MNLRFYIEQAGLFADVARSAYDDFFSFCHAVGFNEVSGLIANPPDLHSGASALATEDFLRAHFEVFPQEQKIVVTINGHIGCDESFAYQLFVSEDGNVFWKLPDGQLTESFHKALVLTLDAEFNAPR